MFWSKRVEKTAIRYRYIINKEEMPSKIDIAPENITRRNIENIKNRTNQFALEVKENFSLSGLPSIQIIYLQEPLKIKEQSAKIITDVIFTYDTPVESNYKPQSGNIMLGLGIMSIVGLIGLVLIFVGLDYREKQFRERVPECIVQNINGQPHSIIIENSEYPLQSDGTMSMETRVFLNPWHREILSKGNCKQVELLVERE